MSARVRRILPWLCLLGIGIAGYLSWVKLSDTEAFCGGIGDCSSVQNSPYAYVLGIPVAYLGFLAYVLMFAIAIFNLRATPNQRSWGELAFFGAAFAGVIFSAYLTYTELFLIKAVCPWCVSSFALLIVITLLAVPAVFGRQSELEA